jgi:two-component system phosphate regulon sensor histidine kinase PhoR
MTAGSPMFRKLLLTSLLVILVALVVLDVLLSRYTGDRERLQAERRLASQARVLAGEVTATPAAGLAEWTRAAAKRSQCRITIISPSGTVRADSEHDPSTMENHAQRPEVAAALRGSQGSAVRRSATLDHDLLYLAEPVTINGQAGSVLRLAVPLEQIGGAIAEVRRRVLEVSLLAALLALGTAYFLSNALSRRIERLKAFAENLVNAKFSETLPPGPDDELGALARSLNRMAAQLRDTLERLRLESARRDAILAGMVEGVLAVDHELCITFCNQAFARAVGAPHPVPERLPVLELVRDPAFLDLLTRVLVTGEPQRRRLQLTAAEGRSYEVQASPLDLRSGRGAIAILHDVTDLERLERVRRDFVANVSHELRTPLAAIQGYAETLLDGALEDRENNRRFLEVIKSHAVRLNQIASDLLSLSELESEEGTPPRETVSVRQVIDAALRSVEPEAAMRKVTIHRREDGEVHVAAHRIRLEQVVVNLLDNAVKFNRPGGEVRVETGQTEDGTLRISVADDGIGIPSEDLPRIFERFYRVDKARSREVGGTGLGLSIVKHAVERMGGKITVESQLGKGSRFTVLLPGD